MERNLYTLDGLAAEVGMKPRTIRYYIERGLVPKGVYSGGGVHQPCYSEEHVRTLIKIRAIRDTQMTLDDIRDYLYPEEDA